MDVEDEILSPVRSRFSAKNKISLEDALEIEREVLKFLYLTDKKNKKYSCLSVIVDEYWHELIMHTEIYYNYCQKHFGRMIHHFPEEYSTPEKLNSARNSYSKFLGDYEFEFLTPPPLHIWPKPLNQDMPLGCKGCNGCAGPINEI